MGKHWYHASSPCDRRRTVGTWFTFSVFFAFYGGCLWFLSGWGPAWLDAVKLGFCAVVEPTSMPSEERLFPLVIATITLVVPIAITLIPTLATLLYIIKLANRSGGKCQRKKLEF